MSNLQICVQCLDKSFEVLADEVNNAELMVEDAMSLVLLKLFDGGTVDEVTISFSPGLRMGLQHCSIQYLLSVIINPLYWFHAQRRT